MELLNKEELSSLLNIRIESVNYLLYWHKIPCVKIGKEYRFIKSEIEDWVRAQCKTPKKFDFSQIMNAEMNQPSVRPIGKIKKTTTQLKLMD